MDVLYYHPFLIFWFFSIKRKEQIKFKTKELFLDYNHLSVTTPTKAAKNTIKNEKVRAKARFQDLFILSTA